MSGFTALAAQGVLLFALVALIGMVVGWSFGSLRASRRTSERYEQQLRATLRRMSEAEADVVTLRANLQEKDGTISSQIREHETREHLLAALEARLAEAEGAAAEERRRANAATENRAESDVKINDQVDVDLDIGIEESPVVQNGAAGGEPMTDESENPTDSTLAQDDDLTRIKGIGKVIQGKLKAIGITSFAQVAELAENDVDALDAALDSFKGRIQRDGWASSAAELQRSEYGDNGD